MQRGPELPGGRRVLWDAAGLLVVDAGGAPLRRLRWPAVRADAPIRRVAVDPAGRLVAALDARGTVTLGGLDGAGLAPLVVAPRTPATPAVASGERPEHPSFDYASTEPWRGGEADQRWPSARDAGRLFFSRDGARLVGGESVWDVATRRPLLALREGDGVLAVDADASRAAVASLGVRTEVGSPGSQCGFVPTSHTLVALAVEARDLVAGAPPQPLPAVAPDDPVPGFDEPAAPAVEVIAALPVDHVALSANGDVAVAVGDRAWWAGLGDARALVWPRPISSVRALVFTAQGLAAQAAFDAGARMVAATALYGRDGRTLRALSGGQQFDPAADGRMVVRDEAWEVWDLRAMERVRALPDPGPLNISALDQARLSGAGVAVVREERGDVRVAWQREFPGEATATAFAGDRLYVADDRGRVSGHSADGAEVAHADLAGRFDHATALAVTPDGSTLAVGTARSRVFVFRVAR
jgi:hypothetical protein